MPRVLQVATTNAAFDTAHQVLIDELAKSARRVICTNYSLIISRSNIGFRRDPKWIRQKFTSLSIKWLQVIRGVN